MPKVSKIGGAWAVLNDDGSVIEGGLSNAQAWRKLDIALSEATCATQMERDIKEPKPWATNDEMQDFYSGLLHIAEDRGYKDGWAFYKFLEKFGHQPEGLHRIPCKPSRSVWGWVNRKAISKANGAK